MKMTPVYKACSWSLRQEGVILTTVIFIDFMTTIVLVTD